jgi:phosphatidate cytidylyltransferase
LTNTTGGNAGSAPRAQAGRTSDLKIRALSSLVLGPAVLAVVWIGGWAFLALVALGGVLAAHEWLKMLDGGRLPAPLRAAASAFVAVVLAVHVLTGPLPAVAAALAGGVAVAFAAPAPFRRLAGLAVPYAAIGAISLIVLRQSPGQGLGLFLFLLLTVWACDIGAYAAGRTIGGPKLAPRISPAKTWAGLIGGAVSSALVGLGFHLWDGAPLVAAAVAPALAVAAQAGDLMESALKRRCKVKDSGHLIPGHGGLLDRIDGLMVAAPVLAVLQAAVGLDLAW